MTKTLKNWIKQHEGLSHFAYKDTVGKLSIGYGRNLDDNGISTAEAEFMLDNDIQTAKYELNKFDWFKKQPLNVQDALTNMCFNLGITKLLKFKKMIAAIEKKDYTVAAMEALNSRWANQVGQRAKDIALMIRETDGYDF